MIRLGTFNLENLFARYRFRSGFSPVGDDGWSRNDVAFEVYNAIFETQQGENFMRGRAI